MTVKRGAHFGSRRTKFFNAMYKILTSLFAIVFSACSGLESSDRKVDVYFEKKSESKISISASRVSEDNIENIKRIIPNLYFMESGNKDFTYQNLSDVLRDYRIGKPVYLTYSPSETSGKLIASGYLRDGYWLVLLFSDITNECRAKLIHVSDGQTEFEL